MQRTMGTASWLVLQGLLAMSAVAASDSAAAAWSGEGPVLIVSTPGTDRKAVHDALSAAGVWVAAADVSAQLEQLLQPAAKRRLRELPGKLSSSLQQQLDSSLMQLVANLTAVVPQGAAWALDAGAATHAVPILTKLLPGLHVMHVVADPRHLTLTAAQQPGTAQAAAELWAQGNQELKAWATKKGLGLARQYSIVRVEDLCSPQGAAAATEAMLVNAGLPASSSVAGEPATPRDGCPQLAPGAAKADTQLYSALTAFDYKPASRPGLPQWLAAPEAMAELARFAKGWPHKGAPAIVTFVSDGYEPILNNWLAWLRDSGASLAHVLVIAPTRSVQHVQRKLVFKGVAVLGLDPLVPDAVAPGTSDELGRQSDPLRHQRSRVWLLRIRVMYELVASGVPVILSDLDAIWVRDASADLLVQPLHHYQSQSSQGGSRQGFDLIMSPGRFPFDIYDQMGVVGCMGFLFANSTDASRALLGNMLLEKLDQLQLRHVKFYNDQRVLNEQLLLANIAVNVSTTAAGTSSPHQRKAASQAAAQPGNPEAVTGSKLSTAPDALRVLFLPDSQYARVCSNATSGSKDAVVVHCQSHNTGSSKMAFLNDAGLWRDEATAVAAA